MEPKQNPPPKTPDLTRREFVTRSAVGGSAAIGAIAASETAAQPQHPEGVMSCSLIINGAPHRVTVDPRVTLLDLLREHLGLAGSKKGCDHGQCGACTVLVNGSRVNACLTLAVAHDGDTVTTIEGLASKGQPHPMQAAFVQHDGFQCGYCTPGQICSAVAMLEEAHQGVPSAVTVDIGAGRAVQLTDSEIRERMAGNICRCGAYPNIVAAVREVSQRRTG